MHLRKLKVEKMIELMRQQNNGPTPNSGMPYTRPAPGYPPTNFYPQPPAQYPPGPYGMPMPNHMFQRHF